MNILRATYKNLKKCKESESFRAKFYYTKCFESLKINDDEVLLQAYDGSSISGNVYYILEELCKNEEYNNFKKYVVADDGQVKNIRKFLLNKKMENTEVIKLHSKQYCRKLAQAKYLINNSTFPTYFIKKEGQVYLNTWHGTPLKAMGRNIKNAPNELGNTQRNFLMADYLLHPNEFTFEHMKNDYMLDNLYKGKHIISGYPRNQIFYNDKMRNDIRKKLGLKNKKVAIYMPTWRGILVNKENDEQFIYIMHTLYELENKVDDNTVIYVKLHNYTSSLIDYSLFNKIKVFPMGYETYEFLNIADCLITDYSSVFFDFANTGRKIILYAYDKEEYLRDRGMYLDYDKLPFNIVTNTQDLAKEINNIDSYEKYDDFKNEYTKHDGKETAKKVCEYVFKNKTDKSIKVINAKELSNNKENVLIFGGALAKNGITTALKGLINHVDKQKRNYILTFYKGKVESNKETINEFKDIVYLPIQGGKDVTLLEALCHFAYFNINLKIPVIKKQLEKIYKREIKRIYPELKFDYVIHYTGYERQIMNLFEYMDTKRIIYIHNDMKKEEKTKSNFHTSSFKDALKNYEKVAVVRKTSKDEIINYYPKIDKNKVCVAHNFNNVDVIEQKAKQEIKFDKDTYCNIELEDLKSILNNKENKKFINIARFSKEKGIDRLIRAFLRYKKNDEDAYLIIIGGYGKEFENINDMISDPEKQHVIIIKSISNPYPILNKCDTFVLSSYYEGLPMTIMEALILSKKVISTSIPGPKEFLEEGYGYLVDNSEDGILNGMNDDKDNKLTNLKKFDAEEFNEKALKEFEELLKN